jgi:DNA-binding MurR/RpiR family transcriptional regulator
VRPAGRRAGCRLLAITDSQMSPLAAMSAVTLVVHESSTFGFRSLTNTMCLAQSLFIALAYRTELLVQPGRRKRFPPAEPV